jgi:branched-chain amino acid aminotransferase
MNIMFVINGILVTAPLSDSILDGVTRDSLLQLATDMGYAVEERQVSVEELEMAFLNNTVTEIFGAGTAAVVAPIRVVGINGSDYELSIYDHNSLQNRLKSRLEQIRTGLLPDVFGWNHLIRE